MAIYYVDSLAGNDANDGSTPALAKATLNGAEDILSGTGHTVRVRGNTTYRETLTCDVSGGSGAEIVYEGDVAGVYWPGSAGPVRITGSDNDQTATRANCITATTKTYRVFRNFLFDSATQRHLDIYNGSNNWIVEDCNFGGSNNDSIAIDLGGATPTNVSIRHCNFWGGIGVKVSHSVATAANNVTIENCYFVACDTAIFMYKVSDVAIRNVIVFGSASYGVRADSLASSASCTLRNSIVAYSYIGLIATTLGELVENYNNIADNATPRNNVASGANSVSYIPYPALPLLQAGYVFPAPVYGALAPWSALRALTDDGSAPSDDLYGITRPATNGKRSWGAVQYQPISKEVTTTYDSSAASLKLSDAGEVQFRVAVTAVETTISVRAYREADYAGTNPRMVIKQPGQSDRTTTDVGDAGEWNELTDTFTPAASPGYVFIVLQSLNTATSGNYDTFFDSIVVS